MTFNRLICHPKSFAAVLGLFLWAFVATPASAGPIVAGTWYEFSFTAAGVDSAGCSPADPAGLGCIPSAGTPTVFADAPAWTFVAPASGSTFTVTDAFAIGDQFEILDFGAVIGMTSVPGAPGNCGSDPLVCLADAAVSSATFALAPGAHSLTIVPLAIFAPGAAYFGVDVAAVPEPATWLLITTGVGLLARRQRALLNRRS